MWRRVYISFAAMILLGNCVAPDMETALTHPADHSEIIDSIAIGNICFGMNRTKFITSLEKIPVQNKMSEPQFKSLVTEIESPVTIGTFTYRGYYYFDNKDRLYKIHLQYQNEKRLVRVDHDEAYENLYENFKTQYGPGISLNTMPGLKAVTWNFKNKKIELTGSCLASNCNMECTITEKNIFEENTILYRISEARLHLQLRLHPENF